jgi:hypothetical protein
LPLNGKKTDLASSNGKVNIETENKAEKKIVERNANEL